MWVGVEERSRRWRRGEADVKEAVAEGRSRGGIRELGDLAYEAQRA